MGARGWCNGLYVVGVRPGALSWVVEEQDLWLRVEEVNELSLGIVARRASREESR